MLIYVITNTITGKQYVGQTTKSLDHRMTCHKKAAKSQQYPLYRAFKKYGLKNFTIVPLDSCDTLDELNEKEQHWISQLQSIAPNGYNLTSGGKRCIISDITRQKMSQSKLGKQFTEAHKKAMSINHHDVSGSKHPRWGKHLSEETKEKIRRPQIGKSISQETRQKMSDAWTDERRAACQKSPRMATCHPDQKHQAKGLCQSCYDRKRKPIFVPV